MEIIEQDRLFNIANKLAWDYYKTNSTFTFDEIQSTAYLGLTKGLASYKEGQGKELSSWIYSKINWEILQAFRSTKKFQKQVPYDFKDDENYSLEERIGSEEFEDEVITETLVQKALTALTSDEINIIYMNFYEGFSLMEMSKKLDISYSTMIRKFNKVLEKMKNKLEGKEINKNQIVNVSSKKVKRKDKNQILIRTKAEAQYIVENQSTLRRTAEKFGVSKSTIHYDMTCRLIDIDKSLYNKVCRVLDLNINERTYRGGQSTKRKYMKGCEAIDCIKRKAISNPPVN